MASGYEQETADLRSKIERSNELLKKSRSMIEILRQKNNVSDDAMDSSNCPDLEFPRCIYFTFKLNFIAILYKDQNHSIFLKFVAPGLDDDQLSDKLGVGGPSQQSNDSDGFLLQPKLSPSTFEAFETAVDSSIGNFLNTNLL